MITVLLAAHQGEEFVLVLPAIMLVGAYFALRWASSGGKPTDEEPTEEEQEEHVPEDALSAAEEEALVQSRR